MGAIGKIRGWRDSKEILWLSWLFYQVMSLLENRWSKLRIRGIVLTYKILVSDFFSSFVQTALDFYTRVPDIVWHI